MVKIDWHISCDKQKKRCILYEDKEEKYPAVELIAKTEEGILEIKPIFPRILEIEGPGGERIRGPVKLSI